jgi:hypothetical protein
MQIFFCPLTVITLGSQFGCNSKITRQLFSMSYTCSTEESIYIYLTRMINVSSNPATLSSINLQQNKKAHESTSTGSKRYPLRSIILVVERIQSLPSLSFTNLSKQANRPQINATEYKPFTSLLCFFY